jgi:succinoglycan biosynthesis protein ExoA
MLAASARRACFEETVSDWISDHDRLPFISVVVPVRNEERYVERCIGSLMGQDYPRDRFEILVVDGRSEDATRRLLCMLQARSPGVALHVLDNPKRTISPALNIGFQAAKGEVIVRMDGHSIPESDYLRACVAALRNSGAASVGGMVKPVGATPFGEAVALATCHPLGAGDAKYRVGAEAGYVDTVPFGAYRRDVLEQVGLFDESLLINEDYELNVRIRAAGEQIYLDPSIRFSYTPRGSPGSLWRQYFRYGWWRLETVRRHPGSLKWRQIVPPAFVTALALGLVLAPMSSLAAAGLLLLLLLYGSALTSAGRRLSRAAASVGHVIAAFVILHLAWGSGFITSLLSLGAFPHRRLAPAIPTLQPVDRRARLARHRETGVTMLRVSRMGVVEEVS